MDKFHEGIYVNKGLSFGLRMYNSVNLIYYVF